MDPELIPGFVCFGIVLVGFAIYAVRARRVRDVDADGPHPDSVNSAGPRSPRTRGALGDPEFYEESSGPSHDSHDHSHSHDDRSSSSDSSDGHGGHSDDGGHSHH